MFDIVSIVLCTHILRLQSAHIYYDLMESGKFDVSMLSSCIVNLLCAAVIQSDSSQPEAASKAKLCTPLAIMCPDSQGTASMEMLVGSQKRKARKTKITHLVRTADGRVSPVEGE